MRKLGKPSDQRKAMLRSLTTALLWQGRIETTEARAKEVRRMAEKLITKAVRTYEDTVTVTKKVGEDRSEAEIVNDAPRRLAARRQIISALYNVSVEKGAKESKYEYKQRTKDKKYPVVDKIFGELAPKYDKRAKELGQGGGYTRILKKGPRRGDAAEVVILELV